MLPHQSTQFNPEISILAGNLPDMAALRARWRTLATEERTAAPGCRLGIAKRRMDLLSAFPAWRIPEIIDALNAPDEEAIHV